MVMIFFVLSSVVISVQSAPISDGPVIDLPIGKVQGISYTTSNNRVYYGFQGIPFAQPPVKELRFEAPKPAQPWNGTLDATSDQKSCITVAYTRNTTTESEDCLYINVYVPESNETDRLPVMLWIYGGGFTTGSAKKSIFGPDFIVERDVIMVSFNYRVGPLGFLSTDDLNLPGNLGLKDQVLALKWTNENIQYFGGDPKKITIFGESAGGASVGLHLLSKQSTGLFRAAILQSGSGLNYWAVDEDPRTTAYLIADAIPGGRYGNDTDAMKKFLKASSVEAIIKANSALPSGVQVWPTLEPQSEDAFLSEYPYQLLLAGQFSQVPIMTGICSEESLYFLESLNNTKAVAASFDSTLSMAVPTNLHPNATNLSVIVDEVKSIYLRIGESWSDNFTGLADLYTDNAFARGILKQAVLSSKYVPVYLYQFAYYGRALTQPFIEGAEKAAHTAELPFLFNIIGLSGTTNAVDLSVQDRVVTMWTDFAKYLDPTPEEHNLLKNLTWPVLDESAQYLNINGSTEVRAGLKANAVSKWNEIYDTYGRKPFVTF